MTAKVSGPSSLESEKAVLGAMLIAQEAVDDVLEILTENSFYAPAHRKIFLSIKNVQDKGIPADLVTVMEDLRKDGGLAEIGGASYLSNLTEEVPSVRNVAHYAKNVRDKYYARLHLRMCQEASDLIQGGSDLGEISEFLESTLAKTTDAQLNNSTHDFGDLAGIALSNFMKRVQGDDEDQGLRSPWAGVSRLIPSFRPGEMIVIAGRPGMGKTTVAMNLFLEFASKQDASILFFSLEMTDINLMDNCLTHYAKIDNYDWRKPQGPLKPDESSRVFKAIEDFSKLNIRIDEDDKLTPSIMRAKARKYKREKGLDAIFIDYLQLMDDDFKPKSSDGRTVEMTSISKQIKSLAKALKVPVFALAQLNRGVEGRSVKEPRASDLRESGGIEQDADVVMMVNRPEKYHQGEGIPERPGEADIIIAKNRHGDTGKVALKFEGRYLKLSDLE